MQFADYCAIVAFKTPNEDGYKTIFVFLLLQYDKQQKIFAILYYNSFCCTSRYFK